MSLILDFVLKCFHTIVLHVTEKIDGLIQLEAKLLDPPRISPIGSYVKQVMQY